MPIKTFLYLAMLFTMTSKWRALRNTCCQWATCTTICRFVKLSDEFYNNNNWFTIYQQDKPIKPSLYLARLFTMTSKWRALRSTCCQWATPASPSIKARYDIFSRVFFLWKILKWCSIFSSHLKPLYLFDNFHTTDPKLDIISVSFQREHFYIT